MDHEFYVHALICMLLGGSGFHSRMACQKLDLSLHCKYQFKLEHQVMTFKLNAVKQNWILIFFDMKAVFVISKRSSNDMFR